MRKKEPLSAHWYREVKSLRHIEGFDIRELSFDRVLEVETQNHTYLIELFEDGIYIKGHPEYCPAPTKAEIHGSTWDGSAIKEHFVGKGMHLEFSVPGYKHVTTTSIKDVRIVSFKGTGGIVQ